MGIFDKLTEKQVQDAQYFARGNYTKPGLYLVEVLKVKEGTMRPPKGHGFFVAEMKVIESSNIEAHAIGSTMTWMTTADKDAFLGNVKHFVAAAGNSAEADIDVEALKFAVSEENPLAGVILKVEAHQIETKTINSKTQQPNQFTKVQFSYVRDTNGPA